MIVFTILGAIILGLVALLALGDWLDWYSNGGRTKVVRFVACVALIGAGFYYSEAAGVFAVIAVVALQCARNIRAEWRKTHPRKARP